MKELELRELANFHLLHSHTEDMLRADLVIINGKVHKDRHSYTKYRNQNTIHSILTKDYPDITYDAMIDGGLIMYPFPDRKIIIMDTNLKFQQIK